ncbi:MAG: hypothetical protein Hyperionvirus48_7 [Hyperionvirus sp.]|uniref:FNIP repeat-containing protein n=1 Tax=Hyperionvirus sp. TaxID=2487770 RepID=A0A3G5ACK3_9VIRU|nr:MAG: hypothetical protein Hyperionvirus48_7 [Hyperionvirus sp.]
MTKKRRTQFDISKRIPKELVSIIASYISEKKDYGNFVKTCKLFGTAPFIVDEYMHIATKVSSRIIRKKVYIDTAKQLALIDKNVRHIAFHHGFNEPLPKFPIGTWVQYIYFGAAFNQTLHNLPASVFLLSFKGRFNQRLEGMPQSVVHLTFGSTFNQPLTGMSPLVTHLTFGNFFNQPLTGISPSLTHLSFGWFHPGPYDDVPPSVTHLTISSGIANKQIKTIPPTVKHVYYNFNA